MPTIPTATIILSVALMTALSLMWYSVVACLLSTKPFTAFYLHTRRWVDRSAGVIFVVSGARLAMDR